jgi:hypothetical protein
MKITKIILIALSGILIFSSAVAQQPAEILTPQAPIPESSDFATLILGDAWDMSEFTDIDQYLNESGQRDIIRNPRVVDGVFYGATAGSIYTGNNGNFYPLFPGYETAMLIGQVGHRYPIDAQLYHCLYFAMQVNSPLSGLTPDRFRVFWFADERQNTAGNGNYGSTFPIRIFEPDADPSPATNIWKLHKVDLKNPPEGFVTETASWNDKPYWQGLRIDPSFNGETDFAVDWVRLTNCQANLQTITWPANGSLTTLWLKPAGTNRYIRTATDINGQSGSYQLDVQGLAAGKYYIGLSQSVSSCCQHESSTPIEINQTPIVEFARPNFYSGPDYATLAGNPWDFQDKGDTVKVGMARSSIVGGVLDIITASGNADPKVILNTPQQIPDAKDYRYLNFRMNTEGAWENVTDGMIARWIWVQPMGGNSECARVSQDIPLNVGWQIYSIDLHDSFNGLAEEVAGSCSRLNWHWLASGPLSKFRFDPNENILGYPLHQQLDWVRLTKSEQVTQGSPFPIRIGLNKPPNEIASIQYYYTNDLNNPTQHIANEKFPVSNLYDQVAGDFNFVQLNEQISLLPMIVKSNMASDLPGMAHEVKYNWDTGRVNPGEYYICVRVNDSFNEAIYCSEATVEVKAP